MKKSLIIAALLLSAGLAQAQPVTASKPSLQVVTAQVSLVMEKVSALQAEWARIKYKVSGSDAQQKAFERLEADAAEVVRKFPGMAEPLIWQAIILSTEAGITGGISALPKVKQAKKLLEASLKIDATALDGSASTSLGSLYYQVPGWPIGFGDDKKAEQYLKAALRMNPEGIDPNFFYGDYLVQQKKYSDAVPVLEKALKAPDRPGREVADEGRRAEIRALLETARGKSGTTEAKSQFN
ncbi:MAG: hypothetical protein ACAH83_01045 [Alphaproteobacteria bacterium]